MALYYFVMMSLIFLLTRESTAQISCDLSYNGTCYLYVESYNDWQSSEDYCVQWGGHLVSIHSEEEFQQLGTMTRGYYFWIGMTDSREENVWEWSDDSDNSYNSFTRDPPYDCYGNQDCAYAYIYSYSYSYSYYYYYRYTYYYGFWNDLRCSYRYFRSVCSQTVPMPSEPRGLQVTARTSTSMTFAWEAPIEFYNSLSQYSVYVTGQDLDTEEREIVIETTTGEDQTYTAYNLEEDNQYTISVTAHTPGGEGRAITIMNEMTLEDAPSSSPTIEGAYSSNPTEIDITWSAPDLVDRNGVITSYTISYNGKTLDTSVRVVTRDGALPQMVTLTSLEEFTQYKIDIAANTAVGAGPIATSFVMTAADAPSAPVMDHIVSSLTSTSIFVSWSPPSLADRNGVLSYKISHKRSSASSYTTVGVITMLSFTLTELEEAVAYAIRIIPVSVGMDGPASVSTATTLMDVPDMSAQNFILSSSATKSLTVTWDPPSAENSNGVIISYTLVYYGVILDEQERMVTLDTSVSGFVTSHTATGLEEDTSYSFSIVAYTSIGSGPAMLVTGYRTGKDAPSSPPNNVAIQTISSTSLRVMWSEIELIDRNGPISYYTVYYHGLRLQPEYKTITIGSNEREALIEHLEEDSEYSVTVSASTVVGTGPASQAMNWTTFSALPYAPISNLNATALSSSSIRVQFDELNYEDRNGRLVGYQVMYWRNAVDSRIHTEQVESTAETGSVSVTLIMLMPYTSYRIEVTAANSNGTGPVRFIGSVYTHEDFPIIEISSTTGSATGPHSASLTWTKPNCANETQISNTLYNLTYRYMDHMQVEHTSSMVTSDNFLPVEKLLPYTEYSFDVTSFTGAGTGSVGPQSVLRTMPKAPSSSASQVILEAINCSTILVTCHPPAAENQNGPLHSYSIFYVGNLFDTLMREVVFELSPETYPDTTVRRFYINELMEYELYSVMVRVSTSVGYSQYTQTYDVRTTEAVPTNTPQDIMASSSTASCVMLEWNPPQVTAQRGAITSYTIRYQGVERDTTVQTTMVQVTPVFPDMRHQQYQLCGLMEDTTYRVSLECENTAGASGYSLGVDFKTQEAAPTAAPTNLMVESHTPYITTLTWSAPHIDHQNGKITYYNIQLTEEGMSPLLIMAPSLSYHLSPLKAHTSYTVTVAAVTSVGSGPSATVTFMTPQDVPSHGVSDLTLTSRTDTTFSLSWVAPLPSQRRGVLQHYKLSYYGFMIDTIVRTVIVELGDLTVARQYMIEELEEANNYTVEVTVVGAMGDGPVSRLTHICTLPIAPSGSVIDLTLVSVTSRYSILSWMPPVLSEHNGDLGDYKLTVTSNMGNAMQYMTMQNSYRIEDLMEHTMYTVSVVSTNMEGDGPSATLSFTTLKNVPSGAPLNFSFSDIQATSLIAHWSPPALEDRNGDLTEYLLVYMGEDTDTSMRSVRIMVAAGDEEMEQSYMLEGLEEYTSYTLVLSVLNDKGESPVVRLQNVLTLSTVPSSPVSELKIETISSKDALISWISPVRSSLNGADVRYRIFLSVGTLGRSRRDSEGTEMFTDGHHFMLSDLSPASSYSLSVQPANAVGMGPPSMIDINTMEDVPSAPVQNITLSSVTSTDLTVSWSAPPLSHQNGDILLYNIMVSAVNSAYQQLVTSSDMMTQVTGLHPDTLYTVIVTPETSMGSGVASSPVEFSTMESVPTAIVNNFSIMKLNATAVLITWTAPASDLQNGVITHYQLTYTSHNFKETFSFTTTQFFIYLYSLNATDGYTFELSAINSMGAGPVVIETLIYEQTPAPAFQFTDKEMSYTISGVLILVIVLMLLFIIVACIVIAICRRRSKATQQTNALEMESYANPRSTTIYTGMHPVKEKPPTYANIQKGTTDDRDSIFKSPVREAELPDIPEKTDAIYAIPHDKTQILNKQEPETYEDPELVGESISKNSTEA